MRNSFLNGFTGYVLPSKSLITTVPRWTVLVSVLLMSAPFVGVVGCTSILQRLRAGTHPHRPA